MKTTVPIELEFEVEFDVQKAEPMRWHYPGHPAEIEICGIKYNGHPVSDDMANEILEDNEYDIIQSCWDEIKETEIDMAISRMEDR